MSRWLVTAISGLGQKIRRIIHKGHNGLSVWYIVRSEIFREKHRFRKVEIFVFIKMCHDKRRLAGTSLCVFRYQEQFKSNIEHIGFDLSLKLWAVLEVDTWRGWKFQRVRAATQKARLAVTVRTKEWRTLAYRMSAMFVRCCESLTYLVDDVEQSHRQQIWSSNVERTALWNFCVRRATLNLIWSSTGRQPVKLIPLVLQRKSRRTKLEVRFWPDCSARTAADTMRIKAHHIAQHCSSPCANRRCCMQDNNKSLMCEGARMWNLHARLDPKPSRKAG
jgi:hypothetical protein